MAAVKSVVANSVQHTDPGGHEVTTGIGESSCEGVSVSLRCQASRGNGARRAFHNKRSLSMTPILRKVLEANQEYALGFAPAPARPVEFAILTCMDARMDPVQFAGIAPGEAHVIRNAGGRASDDAIRSLVISHKLLGSREWFVIHHTRCGMETFTNETMRKLLAESLETATLTGEG